MHMYAYTHPYRGFPLCSCDDWRQWDEICTLIIFPLSEDLLDFQSSCIAFPAPRAGAAFPNWKMAAQSLPNLFNEPCALGTEGRVIAERKKVESKLRRYELDSSSNRIVHAFYQFSEPGRQPFCVCVCVCVMNDVSPRQEQFGSSGATKIG